MKKCFVIAEAGVNHNGKIELAKDLVLAAKNAGADAVKFQTFKTANLVTAHSKKADYQLRTTIGEDTQFKMLQSLELSFQDQKELFGFAHQNEMNILSSAFDLESIDFLESLNQQIYKIPSGEITNYPYLNKIARLKKEVILSTGVSTIGEIEEALNILTSAGLNKDKITVLHCNSEYPTPMKDVNLRAMQTIGRTFDIKFGYSDHTMGIEIPIASVALGASVIEKHFTLNRKMEGPDHEASLEPQEMGEMIRAVRNIEQALGDGIKKPSVSELKNREIIRKSIVAAHRIKKGESFNEKNLAVKRPAGGVSPMRWTEVIGKVAQRDFEADEFIEV